MSHKVRNVHGDALKPAHVIQHLTTCAPVCEDGYSASRPRIQHTTTTDTVARDQRRVTARIRGIMTWNETPGQRRWADARRQLPHDLTALAVGGIAGGVATVPMSLVMVAAEKVGLMGRHPPDLIMEVALDTGGLSQHKEKTRDALAVALHLVFGIGAGALFGVLQRRLRAPLGPALQGVIFGSLVWTLSYLGWVPALGIMPSAERDRVGRPVTMVLAHWVYGGILGAIVGRSPAGAARDRRA